MSKTKEETGWIVDYSDEEIYDVENRMISSFYKIDDDNDDDDDNGKKVWEPCGERIAELYKQIEKNGYIQLKWICPGRRSPSDHSSSLNEYRKQTESNDTKTKSAEVNLFDFDEDQPQQYNNFPKVTPKRRSTQGQRKPTKLDKVMNDMKKYHIMDQQNN